MGEPAFRVVLGSAAVAAVVTTWIVGRWVERRRAEAALPDLAGVDGRVVLFTDPTCRSCDVARSRLGRAGLTFTEVDLGSDPEEHLRRGVAGVPLLLVRDRQGDVVRRVGGVPSRRQLAVVLRLAR